MAAPNAIAQEMDVERMAQGASILLLQSATMLCQANGIMSKMLSMVSSRKTSHLAAINQSTGCAVNAPSALCTDG